MILIFTISDTSKLKKIGDYGNIYSAIPLYLLVNQANGYLEEKNWNEYLIFDDSVNENKTPPKKYADVWDGNINEIKTLNSGEENNYLKKLHEN